MSDFEQRRSDIITMRLLGSPAASCAAWLSAVDKAERDGRPLPTWPELEAIAPSVPLEGVVLPRVSRGAADAMNERLG